MAAADKKMTYTAAEVAELIRPLSQSVEALQKENAELKRRLEHMNEVFANARKKKRTINELAKNLPVEIERLRPVLGGYDPSPCCLGMHRRSAARSK